LRRIGRQSRAESSGDQYRGGKAAAGIEAALIGCWQDPLLATTRIGVMLYRLIYTSRMSQALAENSPAGQIEEIAATSERKNAGLNVTGILVAVKPHFVQVLEGSRRRLTGIYASILRDPRHRDVETIEVVPVERRIFPDWAMALFHLDPARFPPAVKYLGANFDPHKISPEAALGLAKIARAQIRGGPMAVRGGTVDRSPSKDASRPDVPRSPVVLV
jgi:hypothetical protein